MATAVSAAARFILWRLHRGMPGLCLWAWASVVGAVSLGLIALRGVIPSLLSMSLAQLLVVAGFSLAWDGFRRFLGLCPLGRRQATVIALAALGPVVLIELSQLAFPGGESDVIRMSARSVVNSSLVAIICALIARDLFHGAGTRWVAMRLTAWIYAANSAFFVMRVATVFMERPVMDMTGPGGFGALAALWWLGVTLAVTLGMVLMAGERLQFDLNEQVSRDPLTGVFNRRAFTMLAEREMAMACRSGDPLAALMLDLDHFKQINDRFGHAFGDKVLRRFAALVGGMLREEDTLCRMGGEEFVILLPRSGVLDALAVAERVREGFAQERMEVGDSRAPPALSVSIGIALHDPGELLEELLDRADAALYRAKELGRNRTELAGSHVNLPAE